MEEIKEFLIGFEQRVIEKIEAIYDAVTLELDKNLEKSEKIRKLDQRMDRAELNFFAHEKRISLLENNDSFYSIYPK